jgi:peroxiredoxin Q/BCP
MRWFTGCLGTLAGLALLAPPAPADDQKPLKEGDKAPEFTLPVTQAAEKLPGFKDGTTSLSGLKGKNVVLFFFPRALTSGCTVESCGFRDLADQFAKADTVVLGISNDKLDKQVEFTQKESLNFPLLADADSSVCKAFGVLRPDGKAANRVTFVIDKQGVIRKVYTGVKPMGHPAEVLKFVQTNLTEGK